uniref:Uncharacterized protein n=1 Tax=Rhizophora mucronata TaxID=61149 RepID=A0A2P2QIK6_RHIMU
MHLCACFLTMLLKNKYLKQIHKYIIQSSFPIKIIIIIIFLQ